MRAAPSHSKEPSQSDPVSSRDVIPQLIRGSREAVDADACPIGDRSSENRITHRTQEAGCRRRRVRQATGDGERVYVRQLERWMRMMHQAVAVA
jgi:hypothetical protein